MFNTVVEAYKCHFKTHIPYDTHVMYDLSYQSHTTCKGRANGMPTFVK